MPYLRDVLRDFGDGAMDLVFAPVCVSCGNPIPTTEKDRIVCRMCWVRCRTLPHPRCERCWGPVPPGEDPRPKCRTCGDWPQAVRAIRSAFLMGDEVKAVVHALKYRGWEGTAEPMAQRMAEMSWPRDVDDEARVVIPVPTSKARMRERGYNQAALLASAFARKTDRTAVPDLLERTRATRTQTALHPGERRANVARAFSVPAERAAELQGEHVILVDDVWTTGATALACSETLLEAGARVVSVATFARVIPELERPAAASARRQ
jgi:ComF family protein